VTKSNCKNCGDPTTFVTKGDRQADYEREVLWWCRRCQKLAMRYCEKTYINAYYDAKDARDGKKEQKP
jgi:hypothetical protein